MAIVEDVAPAAPAMTAAGSGGYAFPSGNEQGLTKRQYYAAMALTGLFANPNAVNMPGGAVTAQGKGMAIMCFAAADAMMEYERLEAEGIAPVLAGKHRGRR